MREGKRMVCHVMDGRQKMISKKELQEEAKVLGLLLGRKYVLRPVLYILVGEVLIEWC